jgi:opacity protein-like surface antigen
VLRKRRRGADDSSFVAMRTILKLSLLLFLCAPLAHPQSPLVAGTAPVFEAGLGYSYTHADIPSQSWLGLNGVLLSGNADFNRYWGVKAEIGYARQSDAFSTNHSADMLTYMGGPVFYPLRRRRYDVYAEALFGGARETGVNIDPAGQLVTGFVNRFAWAGGGGVQFRLFRPFSVRAGADYLRTTFFNSNILLQGQTNLRASVSLVYTFGENER